MMLQLDLTHSGNQPVKQLSITCTTRFRQGLSSTFQRMGKIAVNSSPSFEFSEISFQDARRSTLALSLIEVADTEKRLGWFQNDKTVLALNGLDSIHDIHIFAPPIPHAPAPKFFLKLDRTES